MSLLYFDSYLAPFFVSFYLFNITIFHVLPGVGVLVDLELQV